MTNTVQNRGVIVDFARTAQAKTALPGTGKPAGKLGDIMPVNMIVPLVNAMITRAGINPEDVTKILTGVVNQESTQGLNIARQVALHEDCVLTDKTGGTTLDRFCGSSMEAIAMADAFISRQPNSVFIAAGVQSMSQVSMAGFDPRMPDGVYGGNASGSMNMGITAENLAEIYEVTRQSQDQFALDSHDRAQMAQNAGCFDNEIVEVAGVKKDDGIRAGGTLEGLAKLRPAFKAQDQGGTVTAANASQISDGASAVIVTSEAFAAKNNLPVKAYIVSFGEIGLTPEIMGMGPVEASKNALKYAGLKMSDMDVVELNEAFAAQSLAVLEEFNRQGMGIDATKLNIDGGAIALGHPLGASGARLVGHTAEILQRTGGRYGLATMCIGQGQGVAMVIENPNAGKPKMTP